MNSGNKLISNSLILLISLVLSRAFRFALVIFSARLLGDTNYGKFSFALAFTSLFLILSDFGTHQLLVRELARRPNKIQKYVGNALFIKIFLAVFTFGLIVVIANFTNKSKDVLTAVYIMGLYQIVFSFAEFFKSIFQAFQKMIYDAMATILLSILTAGVGIVILLLRYSYVELSLMYLLAAVLTLIFCLVISYKKFVHIKLEFDYQLIKYFLREGFPFGVLYFFSMIYIYIATLMLSFMISDASVGWYNAAYRLIFLILFIPRATMKAIFPAMSRYNEISQVKFKQLFEKTFKIMFILGISAACVFSILATKIVLFVYGQEYINSANILRVMVWATGLVFMTTTMTHTTRSSNRQQFTAKIVAIGAGLNIVLNFILIPMFSYMGAVYAYLATEIFIFISHLIYLSRYLFKPPIFALAPKVIAINLAMAAFLINFIHYNIFFLISIALLINLTLMILTGYIKKDEIAVIKEFVKFAKS